MSYSNSSEIIAIGGNISSDDDDEDKGKDIWSRIPGRNSISSRMSFSSPRDSFGSPSPSHSILSLSPASSASGYLSGSVFEPKKTKKSKRKAWYKKRMTIGLAVLMGFFFLMNWWMLYRIQEPGRTRGDIKVKFLKANSTTVFIRVRFDLLSFFLCTFLVIVVVF